MRRDASPPSRLAVIGGGQAAKAMLSAIAEGLANGHLDWRGTRITVFERGSEFGTGLAWSRQNALEEHLSSLSSSEPRVIYGDRQIQQMAGLVSLLAEFDVDVDLVPHTDVVALDPASDCWNISAADGRCFRAHAVVLATGHWTPEVSVVGGIRPWPALQLQQALTAHAGGQVCVIGTGLSGVDAAITLALAAGQFHTDAYGHVTYQAHRPLDIVLTSRSGCLPAVWGAPPPALPALSAAISTELDNAVRPDGHLSLAASFDVFARFAAEYGLGVNGTGFAPGIDMTARIDTVVNLEKARAHDPLATLNREMRAVLHVGRPEGRSSLKVMPTQAFLLMLVSIISECFHALNTEDYDIFQKWFRRPLYRHAMPMALESAQRLKALMQAEVLRVASYAPEDALPTDALIVDATGQRADMDQHADPLWRSLRAAGLAPDARRAAAQGGSRSSGGIGVEPATRRVSGSRQAGRLPLYAMGPLTLGTFVDAQGIGHLMRDAAAILKDVEAQQLVHPVAADAVLT